ncbi:acyltransferase family protein [Terrihabitans soli]|uniref:acyltransferase family protein n=1 Tax=Terrihabitans soli TaxID=708113 RepID=UPI001CA361D7|nr:acyltransferase [Terrihabitans soli]
MEQIRALTTIRFVAAFYVFLFHMHVHFDLGFRGTLARFVNNGAVGMTIFFVLSGFILAVTYGTDLNVRKFAVRRVARIVPVYTLAALLTLPWFWGPKTDTLTEATVVVLAHLFMVQAWDRALFPVWNFSASWSLSAEAFFYLCFPALLWMLRKRSNSVVWAILAIGIAASLVPAVAWHVFHAGRSVYSVPIWRFPEFISGACAGVLYARGMRFENPGRWAIAAFTIFVCILCWVKSEIYVDLNVIALPSILILLATIPDCRIRALESNSAVFLGKISFAAYLLQTPLIFVIRDHKATPDLALLMEHSAPFFALALAVLLAASALVFLAVEEPARAALTKRFEAAKREKPDASAAS